MSKRLGLLVAMVAAVLGPATIASATAGAATSVCSLVASPDGSDSNPGTVAAPFGTAQKMVSSLRAGQTGCLRAGTYSENVAFRNAGTAAAPITLTVYPGETATIVGRVYVAEGADYTTVTGLNLDGVNAARQQSPMIDANHVTFSYDDVTNDHTSICFGIGSPTWGWATGTVITHSRIHDCGVLPATNLQHGFYIGGATDTTIEWDLIYNNADRGIQLYPEADYTTIDHNIIDGNGEGIIISGTGGVASSYTNVYDNVLSNATQRHDVESWWPAGNPVGVGNTVHDNCVWGGHQGTIDASGGGFTAQDNIEVDPQFASGSAHDYEMNAASPCLALVGDVQAAVDGTPAIVPSGTGGGAPGAGNGSGSTATAPSGGGPVGNTRLPSQTASHPKPKPKPIRHSTRKSALRNRRKPKHPAKRAAAKRPARRSGYPRLRRLP
jgi:hypothetical protein